MVKYVKLLVAMMVTMFATSAMAYNPPPSPKPAGNIVDQAHVLTPQELGRLNSQLRQVNTTSANEIGVLIIPTLDGNDIRDVGLATGRAWGVGKKDLDNGVMIVWVPGDRKIGIETGKGVEGDLPDLKCNDIIRNVMGPEFRQHHFEAGLGRAFTTISSTIADHRQAVVDRDAFNAAHPPSNAVAAGGASPQTSTTSTNTGKGCDVSGAPVVNRAGFGGTLVWLALILGGYWVFRNMRRRSAKREMDEALAERQRREQIRQQELEQLNAAQEATRRENEARVQAARPVVVPTPPVYIPVHREPLPVVHEPTAVATVATATVVVADRIRQEQEEERQRQTEHLRQQAQLLQLQREREARQAEEERQERLERLASERRRREQEEETNAALIAAAAATAAVIATSSDDDDDNSSNSGSSYESPSYDDSSSSDSDSSSSDSSSDDFGGGDFDGGGSSDSY